MADNLTQKQRSYCMSRIRSSNTSPELQVRRLTHRLGYRYRIHDKRLPGCPDIVFPGRRKVIFVHGCFWHRHRCRRGRVTPKMNARYWGEKLRTNRERDGANRRLLRTLGWDVLVVWECQISDLDDTASRLLTFLGD